MILITDGRQSRVPLVQCLVLCVRDVAQGGSGHPWHSVRGRQGIQQLPGVVGDDAVELAREIVPQVGMDGEKRFDRNARTVTLRRAVVLWDDIRPAAAVAQEFPRTARHGTSRRSAGGLVFHSLTGYQATVRCCDQAPCSRGFNLPPQDRRSARGAAPCRCASRA